MQGVALLVCCLCLHLTTQERLINKLLIPWPFCHPFLEELEPFQKAFPISCDPAWSPKSSYSPHTHSQRRQRHFFSRTVKLLCPSMGQFLLKKTESLYI